MPDAGQGVRCLQVPLAGGMTLLVPNAAVAEVVTYSGLTRSGGGDPRLLGHVEWRGVTVPVLSFEAFCGGHAEAAQVGRMIVLHRLGDAGGARYFALAVDGIPHLSVVRPGMLQEAASADAERPVLQAVLHGEQQMLIPDLEKVERELSRLA